MQKLFDDGTKWMVTPENQKKILNMALDIALVVLPEEGDAETARKVLEVIAAFVRGNGGK